MPVRNGTPVSYTHLDVYKRQGYYRYNSLEDFLSGAAPESFALTYGFNGVANPNACLLYTSRNKCLRVVFQVCRYSLNIGITFYYLFYSRISNFCANIIFVICT